MPQPERDPEPDKRMTFPNPMLVVVSGPSGVGKSTIVAELADRRPQVVPIVTATTRERRPGRSTRCTTTSCRSKSSCACVTRTACSNRRRCTTTGTARRWSRCAASWRPGRDAILTIDPQGARSVRQRVPDALLIFVMPPSIEDLDARLAGRGSEDANSLAVRRRNAEVEMASSGDYDYVIVNETGHPDDAADRIWEIIQAEARRDPPRQVRV